MSKHPEIESFISSMPGYRPYEYLLVLSPHTDLSARIAKIKEEFAQTYHSRHPRGQRQHLTLAAFTQLEMMEEKIKTRLKTIAMGYHPFKVELKDFGSFPSHTLYINVTSRLPVENLVKEIRTETQRLMKWNDEHKPYFVMDPYISIASRLKPWQYEKGWQEYSQRHFSGRFIADSMLLLKRPPGETRYQVLERLEFQNLPVTTRQGELFG